MKPGRVLKVTIRCKAGHQPFMLVTYDILSIIDCLERGYILMSKMCTVCGYQCEDTVTSCPVCDSPFSVSPQPALTVTEQVPAGMPSQNTMPSQAVPPIQPQPAAPIPGVPPMPQQFVPSNAYTPYPQGPAMQGQNIQGIPEPPKKKSKTVWIVLGIVGGVLLLLIILAIILMFALKSAWNNHNDPSILTPASTSHPDHHEYYYADYDSASFQSEAFVDVTMEDPASVPSTEEPENPDNPVSSGATGDFRTEDLMIYSIEDEGIEPYTYTIEENCCYTIGSSTGLLQTGSGSIQEPSEFENKLCQLGRGIQAGSSIDECINAYGIDTTNAIWQLYENNTFSYYYYSTTIRPDSTANSALVIGWCKKGDTWQRMYPVDLFNYWQNGTPPECDNILMYILYTNDSVDTISSMNIMYGDHNYFQEFYTSWKQVQNYFNEAE